MVEIDTTTISSKGQIVIPANMRKDIKEGDKFLIIRDKSSFLLKKADDLDEKFKEDLEFARRTEEVGTFSSIRLKKKDLCPEVQRLDIIR